MFCKAVSCFLKSFIKCLPSYVFNFPRRSFPTAGVINSCTTIFLKKTFTSINAIHLNSAFIFSCFSGFNLSFSEEKLGDKLRQTMAHKVQQPLQISNFFIIEEVNIIQAETNLHLFFYMLNSPCRQHLK